MPRVLILATTTGYQTRAFGAAAEQLRIELVFATDRCNVLEDPWRDRAIPIHFHDEEASVAAIVEAAAVRPIAGVLAVGDRPTLIAARAAAALGLPWHPPSAATLARHKLAARERFEAAGLLVPRFARGLFGAEPRTLGDVTGFPAVLKPLALSGSRGVMRVDTPQELSDAVARLHALLTSPEVRAERDQAHDAMLLESFIDGKEFALEGLMDRGRLRPLAIFDKPDPLDGPFFEETIYVTPSSEREEVQEQIVAATRMATSALGLYHGPIHAECRVNRRGVFMLEVAARPIGGLCAGALRFVAGDSAGDSSLEALLLRHAIGESTEAWRRERCASAVMMIPIQRRGILRSVGGEREARAVPGITGVRITAKPDQMLVPLPEGASYLGFIFARGPQPAAAVAALREAHSRLTFELASEIRVLQSPHG